MSLIQHQIVHSPQTVISTISPRVIWAVISRTKIGIENLTRDSFKALGQEFKIKRMSDVINDSLLMEKVYQDNSMKIGFLVIPVFDQMLQWT